MKQKIIILLSLLLTLSVCIGFVIYCQEKDRFDYPNYFTREYCRNNYSYMDDNYMFEYAYKNCVEDLAYKYRVSRTYFHAIPNISPDDFLVCRRWLVGNTGEDVVMLKNNNKSEPMEDWTISSIEICICRNLGGSRKKILQYGKESYVSSIKATTNVDLITQLQHTVNDKDSHCEVDVQNEMLDNYMKCATDSDMYYTLRISFEETEMITWNSGIVLYEGQYYLVRELCYDTTEGGRGQHRYVIYLTDDISESISSAISSYSYDR